ncbi:glycosyltransferase [Desulfuromonas sp. DDH964]|uniref:glycosyltransferase family 4 protein n=1 Tax=Desulfuromonas sp. DDH964 TaxID=1823759 RepID=UPI00078DEDB2|nr:glycosyltransferase family 4 protein [Desulfuromonas sp. DDH964]AMV73143.1 glycosyltransferase [Desulfuromonas sp. DDH964]
MFDYGFFKLTRQLLFGNRDDRTVVNLNRTAVLRLVVTLCQLLGWLFPFSNKSGLFFFFPFFHIGGAEKVHSEIVGCVAERKPWVCFTKKSLNRALWPAFEQGARLWNLWAFFRYLYPMSVGMTAGFINRYRQPVVFGSNSLFFALLIPYLKPHVRCIDLTHAFGGGAEDFMLSAATRLDKRVVINRRVLDDLTAQYRQFSINPALVERIEIIGNAVQVPRTSPSKTLSGELLVLFVGRDAPEKRVHLVGQIARRSRDRGLSVRFVLVGDFRRDADRDWGCCELHGVVTASEEMASIYSQAHVLLITSSREGFPLVVMEAMANGVVPVCTAVGGIPEHVHPGWTGLLVEDRDEEMIVADFVEVITELEHDREEFARLSESAHRYARDHFAFEAFRSAYRRLLLGEG